MFLISVHMSKKKKKKKEEFYNTLGFNTGPFMLTRRSEGIFFVKKKKERKTMWSEMLLISEGYFKINFFFPFMQAFWVFFFLFRCKGETNVKYLSSCPHWFHDNTKLPTYCVRVFLFLLHFHAVRRNCVGSRCVEVFLCRYLTSSPWDNTEFSDHVSIFFFFFWSL